MLTVITLEGDMLEYISRRKRIRPCQIQKGVLPRNKSYNIQVKIYVVITSFNEPITIGKAIEQIICPNRELWPSLQLVVVAPDESTLNKAEEVCQKCNFKNVTFIKDHEQGKPVALDLAVDTITRGTVGIQQDDLLILTDGDVYLGDDAIKNLLNNFRHDGMTGGVGGHPVSVDSRGSMFGYFSHLFCEAAHVRRTASFAMMTVSMSGYLYAIRGDLLGQIFPIPAQIRAEDAYISQKTFSLGYKIAYAPNALVYVKFPKNLSDWYKQKTRSLGGNVQLSDPSLHSSPLHPLSPRRSIIQDLQMAFFPLTFAKSPKELFWSLLLYPLRFLLWIRIYYNHALKRYKSGAWERIDSSK